MTRRRNVGQALGLRRRLTPPSDDRNCGAESPAQARGLPHKTSLPHNRACPSTHEI